MNSLKKIISKILAVAVKILLARKKPTVIGITGSVGKTSCKEFTGKLLSEKYSVLVSSDGYNTEIGAPLALFGEKIPDRLGSIFGWIGILSRIYWKAFTIQDFPEKIVIEMGTDTPGEIRYLATLFQPRVAVVLEVLPVHLLGFKTVEEIAAEKSELVRAIPSDGTVYLNYDNPLVRDMNKTAHAKVVYFGKSEGLDGYRATAISSDIDGLSFSLKSDNKAYHFSASLFGDHTVYPLLAAIAVANGENIPLDKIRVSVSELKPFRGRMNVIDGINQSLIIDDSYNANPGSVVAALDFLSRQKGRRIAVLGNMNELGDYEEKGHIDVGKKVANSADFLITVGEIANKLIVNSAIESGFDKKNIKMFLDSKEAGDFLKTFIKRDDIVLVKGSQNKVRLERAIEKIMKHPEQKNDVLVRQSEFWDSKE